MRFSELPIRLRAYILAHVLVLAPAALLWQPVGPAHLNELCLLLLFTLVFSTWKVELTVFQGRMTLAFAVVRLAQLLQGLPAALLCAAAGAAAGTLLRPGARWWKLQVLRPPLYRFGFNLGNCLLSCLLASLTYTWVHSRAPSTAWASVPGLIAFTAVYFAVNTLGVSLAIAFQQQLSWLTRSEERRVGKEGSDGC